MNKKTQGGYTLTITGKGDFIMRKWKDGKRAAVVSAAIILLAGVCALQGMREDAKAASIQESIAGKILRFHVIANSDKKEDQALKLKVRDGALAYMQPFLSACESQKESEEAIEAHLLDIQERAQEIVHEQGSAAVVSVSVEKRYFPVKKYGDLVFPEGDYDALCIEIGAAQGKNWWCVLYPRLCFVDSLYAVAPDDSKEELRELLTPEEYEAVLQSDEKIVVKSKLLEMWQSFWE